MNDTGIWTAEEINKKFLNAILNKHRVNILKLMEKINKAALNTNQIITWNIEDIKEEEYYNIATFLKKKGFDVAINIEKNTMSITW